MRLLRDTRIVFRRYIMQQLGNPAWIAIGVIQPVMYLVLFGPLLKSVSQLRGFPPGGAYNVFVPGLLVQLGLFGAAGVGFGLIAELRQGVIERIRVTPISRMALLLGRALRDMVVIVTQSALLIVCALPFGLTLSLEGMVVALVLIALVGLVTASIAYSVALAVKSEDVYPPIVFTSALPLLLLSGVLLPLTFAPQWLQTVADFNPLAYAVDAARHAFNNNIGDPSIYKGFGIMLGLGVVAIVIAGRAFGRAVA